MNLRYTSTTADMFTGVPADCEIIVKDDRSKTKVTSLRKDFTNVKTVDEL
jgi:hypothetical protein